MTACACACVCLCVCVRAHLQLSKVSSVVSKLGGSIESDHTIIVKTPLKMPECASQQQRDV